MEQERLNRLSTALDRHRIGCTPLSSSKELRGILESEIPEGSVVAFGGSMTLAETGTLELLREWDKAGRITLLDRGKPGLSPAEIDEVLRRSFFADVYLTSVNALTEDGFLYNVDGNGNRVAAMIFGPKKVLVIAGTNKLVPDREGAVERVRQIAAPQNAKRLNRGTPCVQTGHCCDCLHSDRICCTYTFFGLQRDPNRMHVILIDEVLGY